MIVNLQFISACIDSLAQQGRMAAEIHCSAATHKMFVAAMVAHNCSEGPYEPSLRLRFMFWKKRRPPVWKFRGIPLVVNPLVPDLGILIRPVHLLGNENWMAVALEEQRQIAIAHQVATMPMPQEPAESEVKSSAAFTGNGSPTDILIRAATDCDSTRTVIVIKVDGDNQVEIMTNSNRFGLFGILNAALSRVAQGE
jgi:hypothetical protein